MTFGEDRVAVAGRAHACVLANPQSTAVPSFVSIESVPILRAEFVSRSPALAPVRDRASAGGRAAPV